MSRKICHRTNYTMTMMTVLSIYILTVFSEIQGWPVSYCFLPLPVPKENRGEVAQVLFTSNVLPFTNQQCQSTDPNISVLQRPPGSLYEISQMQN